MIIKQSKTFFYIDRDFIASRRVALEKFLQAIVIHPLLRNALIVRQFLDPRTYSQNFQGILVKSSMFSFSSSFNQSLFNVFTLSIEYIQYYFRYSLTKRYNVFSWSWQL